MVKYKDEFDRTGLLLYIIKTDRSILWNVRLKSISITKPMNCMVFTTERRHDQSMGKILKIAFFMNGIRFRE